MHVRAHALNVPVPKLTHLALLLSAFQLGYGDAPAQPISNGRVEVDLPYVESGEPKQQLDLYIPPDGDFPTVLFIHGGSLMGGDRKEDEYMRLCRTLQEKGIGCAAMSDRLAPAYNWPAQPDDAAAAFAGRALAAGACAELAVIPDRTHTSALEKMANPDDPGLELLVRFVEAH